MGFAPAAAAAVPQGREEVRDPAAGRAGPARRRTHPAARSGPAARGQRGGGGSRRRRSGDRRPERAGRGLPREPVPAVDVRLARGDDAGGAAAGGGAGGAGRGAGPAAFALRAGLPGVRGVAAAGHPAQRVAAAGGGHPVPRWAPALGLRRGAAGGREGRTGGEGGAGGRPPAAHAPGAESGAPGCGPSPGPVGGRRRRRRGAALAVRRGGAPPLADRGAGAAEPPRPALGPGLPSRLKIRPGVEGEAMRRRGCSSRARGAELRHTPPLAARLGTLRWSNRSNRQRSAVARPLLPADVSAARGVRGRYEPRSSAPLREPRPPRPPGTRGAVRRESAPTEGRDGAASETPVL